MQPDLISITDSPINQDEILGQWRRAAMAFEEGGEVETGAMVTFEGVVRPTEGERVIDRLDYEHYEGMAEQEMSRLLVLARERWPLRAVALVHRVGPVPAGEASVLVAVAAGHRVEAFEAARFLIDELKKSVPIWKHAPPA